MCRPRSKWHRKEHFVIQGKKIAEKKYKDEFNFRLFLEQLDYLEDIKREKIKFLKEKAQEKK